MGGATHSGCGFCGVCVTCISHALRGASASRESVESAKRLNAWFDRRTAHWRAIIDKIMGTTR